MSDQWVPPSGAPSQGEPPSRPEPPDQNAQPQYAHPQYAQPHYGHPQYPPNQYPPNPYAQYPYPPGQYAVPAYAGSAHPADRRPTSAWAIASLVTGVLPLPPAAIVTAIVAFVRMRRRNQAGIPFAVGGLVGAFVWLCVGALVAIFILAPDPASPVAGDPSQVPAQVGACVLLPDDPSDTYLQTSCDGDHYGEVFFADDIPEPPAWRSRESVANALDSLCFDRFEDYVGESYFDSDYDYVVFAPDRHDWDTGNRRGVCLLVGYGDDTLSGPAGGRGGTGDI